MEISELLHVEVSDIENEANASRLMDKLNECVSITITSLLRIGAIIRRLESLGVDLISVKIPNMDYFRRIAHGAMLPSVFVNFAGSPGVMRKVSRLPIPDQKRVADGEPIKVMMRGGDFVMVKVENMTSQQVKQVFSSDHIRSESQQIAWLISQESMASPVAKPPVTLDRRRHGIVVGEVFVSASEMAKYLADLAEK